VSWIIEACRGGEMADKNALMCKKIVLKMLKYVKNVCQYFSQYSDDKDTM